VRTGRRVGVDVGTVRIGTALSDPEGLLAVPLETVPRGTGDVDRIVELVAAHDAVEVVVGLPVSLDGTEGPSAAAVRAFVDGLAARLADQGVPVRLVDERLSTAGAHRALQAAGVGGRRRRAVVDESAAAMILQTALDTERSTGSPAGAEVVVSPTGRGRG
jgi:putative holliday junction resolvase